MPRTQRSHNRAGREERSLEPIQPHDRAGALGQIRPARGQHDDVRYPPIRDRAADRSDQGIGVRIEVVGSQIERQQREEPGRSLKRVAQRRLVAQFHDAGLGTLCRPCFRIDLAAHQHAHPSPGIEQCPCGHRSDPACGSCDDVHVGSSCELRLIVLRRYAVVTGRTMPI